MQRFDHESLTLALQRHPTAHFEVDPQGKVWFTNDALAQLVGRWCHDLRGRDWRDLLRPSARSSAPRIPVEGAARFRDAAGEPIPVDLRVFDLDWTEEGWTLVAIRDARVEAELRASLARRTESLREVAGALPGALFQYELHADGSDRVTYVSTGCRDLWEVEAEDVEEDAGILWEMIDPDDVDPMRASIEESGRTLADWFHEWRITTPSGAHKWLQATGVPHRAEGGAILWNTFIVDVTDRRREEARQRRIEAELREARQLEALGRIAAGVAHDFNNVLTVIGGFAQSAIEEAAEGTSLHDDLSELAAAARRSAGLTRQLLSFVRHEPSKVVRFDVNERLGEVERLLGRLVGAAVSLEFEFADSCPAVRMDPVHLDQVVTNLVLNARDALEKGGRITLGTAVTLGNDGTPGVLITVSDTGHGMDEETLGQAFQPFFSTKDSEAGTGLGLATVQRIVTECHGHVRIDSTPGEGTTVKVWLPEASDTPAPEAASPEPAPAPVPSSVGTILVIEDERPIRTLLRRALQRAGYDVRTAADGEEGLAAARELGDRLSLVISDVVLPERSGPDVVAAIFELRRVPALFITGYIGDEHLGARIMELDVPILRKPFSMSTLLEVALRQLTSGKESTTTS